jgi:hypothetical protein
MRGEFEELAGIRYSPHTLIAADRELVDFFHWAASLPRPVWGGRLEPTRANSQMCRDPRSCGVPTLDPL